MKSTDDGGKKEQMTKKQQIKADELFVEEMTPLFRVSAHDPKILEIPFDELFDDPELAFLNKFDLKRKRSYCNISELIAGYSNKVYAKDRERQNELPLAFLIMKHKIEMKGFEDEEQFISELYENIFTPYVIDLVNEVTDDNYILHLDSQELDKYNPGLQFNDHHAKILSSISTAMKLMIPLCADYTAKSPHIMTEDISRFFLKCFDKLFEIFSPNVAMLNKLYQSIHSRVIRTKYSDSTYWYYAAVMGVALEELIYNLSKKMIIDAIPKYTFEKNMVSFNHVYIENNIKYSLKINFPIKYKILSLVDNDENGLSDFDKLTINTTKLNESTQCINKVDIQETIKKLKKTYDIRITKKEIDFYKENFSLNKLQRTMLFLYYGKYFSGIENLYNCDLHQYVKLLIIMQKKMRNENFTLLPELLTAKNVKLQERKVPNKKNLIKIIESPKYKDIIETKYTYTQKPIIETSQITQEIATILVNKFTYCSYKNPDNGKEILIKPDRLIEEMLRFVETI